jgi:LacI family transcriptional regulator
MRPTVHDIASVAGVSLATVDRVLNNRPGVRRQTIEKVEGAIKCLGYVRDVAAANLAKRRLYPLVFIVPGGPNSFMRNLEAEVRAAAERSAIERTSIRIETYRPWIRWRWSAHFPVSIRTALPALRWWRRTRRRFGPRWSV